MSLQKYSAALSQAFEEHVFGEYPKDLYEPLHYILSLGGKRIRPLLTVVSAGLFSKNWEKAIKPAMAVEVFHNFTLMHDDIMDQAPIRRGKETVHIKWDVNTAILSGDVMLVCAYELLSHVEPSKLSYALKRFNKTAAEVCEGQQLDMMNALKPNVTKEEYLEMIRLKTSVLVGFALELGAIVEGQSDEVSTALYNIGVNIGLGFQQMDDVLDVWADPEKFGKQVGGDILENKKTWLLLRAFEKAEGTPFEKELMGWMNVTDQNAKVNGVRTIFETLGIKEEGTALAYAYFDKAVEEMKKLSVTNEDARKDILNLIEQIKFREK